MALHLKVFSMMIITIYLRSGLPLLQGPNAERLAEVGRFLRAHNMPWILAGDFNKSPEEFVKSGWLDALGSDAQIVTMEDRLPTCYRPGR